MTSLQNLKVGAHDPLEINVPSPVRATVTNLGPAPAYYSDRATFNAVRHDGVLPTGESVEFDGTRWFLSAGRSRLVVKVPDRLSWLEQQIVTR